MTYSPKAFQIATLGTSQIGKFVSTHGTTGDVIIPDNDKFSFGTGSDASIYFDATNLVIADEDIPVQIGNASNTVTIAGNLTVNGTTTTINSTTMTVDDLNLVLASGAADSNAANGAGITIDGASATLLYTHSTTSWDMNKPLNVTGAGTFSGILRTDDLTDATSKTDGSLQTDGGLSVAKAIYNGTAATLAADSGIVTIGSTTAATFSAAGLLNVNNATEATSTTDGSLQTDGGLSVVKDIVGGDDLILLNDSAVIHFGLGQDVTLTHTNDVGLHLNGGMRFAFRDQGGEYLTSASDGHLEVNAGATLDMTAPTVDINASTAVTIDGPSVTIANTATTTPILHITQGTGTDDATSGELRFNKDSASGADSDVMGLISFYGTDAAENTHERLAYIDAIITDSAHGSEAASLRFYVAENDATLTQGLLIAGQADSDGEVDVTIGAGAASTTTVAGDLTVNGGDILVAGATPKITIGDADTEDTMLVFDGNAADYRIGLDDGTDALEIGAGSAHGTTAAIIIDSSGHVTQIGQSTAGSGKFLKWDGSKAVWDDATATTATTATNVVITDNENTDQDTAITFVAGADIDGSTSVGLESDGDLTYNPSKGRITATDMAVNGVFVNSADVSVVAAGDITKGFTGVTTAGSNRQMDLPEASAANIGAMYTIKKLDAGIGQVKITRDSTDDTIDGGTGPIILYHQNESVTLIVGADTKWFIM